MSKVYIGVDASTRVFIYKNKPVWQKSSWQFTDKECVAPWLEIAEMPLVALALMLNKSANAINIGDLYEIEIDAENIETHDWEN